MRNGSLVEQEPIDRMIGLYSELAHLDKAIAAASDASFEAMDLLKDWYEEHKIPNPDTDELTEYGELLRRKAESEIEKHRVVELRLSAGQELFDHVNVNLLGRHVAVEMIGPSDIKCLGYSSRGYSKPELVLKGLKRRVEGKIAYPPMDPSYLIMNLWPKSTRRFFSRTSRYAVPVIDRGGEVTANITLLD